MFALVFRFPAGRYHATPWGRNVNEADVAWPPEPWRILRAMVATWWRKGDKEQWSEEELADLVDALAGHAPIYHLPDSAVHAHTRHYMPAPLKTTLVFDAFARVPRDTEIVVAWLDVLLPQRLFALASDLALGIGYLGRAESWADCEARAEWDASAANCFPEGTDKAAGEPVRLIAPREPDDYAAERARLLAAFEEREHRSAIRKSKKPPSAKTLATAQAKAFGATLPVRLVDALTLDTADYQQAGWSRPPASRELIYLRRPLSPTARPSRARLPSPDDRSRYTVARYVLAGKPRPRIEDAVKIGELMRLAALAQFGWTTDEATGHSRPNAPGVISGRDSDNRPLRDPEHRHAFWLPEDADEDGEIDHMVVYAKEGFASDVRQKLDRLTRLWIAPGKRSDRNDNSDLPPARREWRLALEGFGQPSDFANASRVLRPSRTWESVTPFLAAGHLKSGGYPAEIRRLASRMQLPEPIDVGLIRQAGDRESMHADIIVRGRPRRSLHFHRFRSRGREEQPDTIGTFARIVFPQEIEGPLALGYACHFGLGLFGATR